MPSPYRREELIAEMATLVYLLSGMSCETLSGVHSKDVASGYYILLLYFCLS
jgi:hypothetical protein